jgi:alkylhydroperoxidase/carboxymuconolactone decarboxylase family protein YurZ
MSLTQRQQHIKDEFTQLHGTWDDAWEDILRLDPEFLASYLQFSAVPWRKNHLNDKVKEFIYLAIDATATHLYEKGLKLHIENALGYGATAQEILEVMEIASVLGIHAVTSAAPILAELAGEVSETR